MESPPKQSRKLPIIIGAAVVVVIIVALVIVLGGGDDKGGSSFDAAAAHDGLRTVLDDATYDDTGYDALRVCPLGDVNDLFDAISDAIGLDPAVAEGGDLQSAHEEGVLPAFVSCQRYAEDIDAVDKGADGLYFQAILNPPRDYEGYVADFAGDSSDINYDEPAEYKDGKVYLFCWDANDDDGFTGCEADWVDTTDKIALNLFIDGVDTTSAMAFTALKAVLAPMAASLADLATPGS